jgi:hypothetical protein
MTALDDAVVNYLDPKKRAWSGVQSLLFTSVVVLAVMLGAIFVFLPGLGCQLFNWTVNGCPIAPPPPLRPPEDTPLRIAGCDTNVQDVAMCVSVAADGGSVQRCGSMMAFHFSALVPGAPPEQALYTIQIIDHATATAATAAKYVVPKSDARSTALTWATSSAEGAWQLRGTLQQCFLFFVNATDGTRRGALSLRPAPTKGGPPTVTCDPSALYSADAWQLLSLTASPATCPSSA